MLSSPIVLGLVGTLVVLLVLSVALWKIIVKTTAERQYNRGFESIDAGDYRNAVKQLDDFLTANPDDKRAGKAKVFRALANVRQYTSTSGASWENAVKAAEEMVSEVGGFPEYRDASTELAEQLVKAVEGLADRARASADPETLRAAESALAFERRVAGKASEALLSRSRALPKLNQAREAIRRAQARARAFAAIDAALAAGSAEKAYAGRDALVGLYADMASDRELIERLVKAKRADPQGGRLRPLRTRRDRAPRRRGAGPATTLVLRLDPGSKPAGGPVVYALSDGLVTGLDGANGAPLWQVSVGHSSPFAPQVIAGGDASILVVDAVHDELIRLDGKSGKLAWRQELGERVVDPPLVLGNQIYQATPSGKILAIDLSTGALRGTLNVGRKLARSPVVDESGEHLYVLGEEDCLFVLGREPLSCLAVEYLGHEPGSIACAPARVGRFLIVAENTTLADGQWRVFVLDESGVGLKLRQTLPVAGWTWGTPSTLGSVIWSASDRGEIFAYSIGLYDSERPIKPIASIAAEPRASGPAIGLARSEREFWVAGGRPGRFELNTESGKLGGIWTLGSVGAAIAPVQVAGRVAVFTQQATDGPGVALWGVDAQSGSVRWRTTLGAAWPAAPTAGKEAGSLATVAFDGGDLVVGPDLLARGGFVEQPMPRSGSSASRRPGPSGSRAGESTILVPSPTGSQMLVRQGSKFRPIDLPSPLGARPIAWGPHVLVPGVDGRVYLIDPATGESAADPFVPPFDKDHPYRWTTPMLVEGDAVVLADREGRVRRLVKSDRPRPRLAVTGEASLGQAIVGEPASTGGAVFVATLDGKIRSLAARDLSPSSTVDLSAPRTSGPVAVGDHAFVSDAAGDVFAFGPDGQKRWQARLHAASTVPPAVRGGSAWFATRSGSLEARSMADGSAPERIPLGALPAGPPVMAGARLVVPTGLGSLRAVADEHLGAGAPRSEERIAMNARLAAALAVAATLAAFVALAPRTGRAQVAADPNAKGKEVIARAPFDRITLIDNTTWEIEPLSPRPLPVFDPTKKPPRRKAQLPHNGNIGVPGQKSILEEDKAKDEDDEDVLLIHMLSGDVRDYKVRREHIKAISYFEDMLIEEAERLTSAGRYGKAFEYLLMVQSRAGRWARLDEAVDRLLFAEGSQALLDGDGGGLRLLGELYRRRPKFPGLADKLANSFLVRIKKAFDVGAYATGRQVLREFESLAPDNPAVREGRGFYEGRARSFFDRAKKADGAARLDMIRTAADVWPALDGLESVYREAFAAMPTLDVAVAELPEPVGPWVNSAASARTSALLYRPILAATTEEGLKGSLPGQLAASVETFDSSREGSGSIRPVRLERRLALVAALDVARMLVDRAVPTPRLFRLDGPTCSTGSTPPRTSRSRSASLVRACTRSAGSWRPSARRTAGATAGSRPWTRAACPSATARIAGFPRRRGSRKTSRKRAHPHRRSVASARSAMIPQPRHWRHSSGARSA